MPGAFAARYIAAVVVFSLAYPAIAALLRFAIGEDANAGALLADFSYCLAVGFGAILGAAAAEAVSRNRFLPGVQLAIAVLAAGVAGMLLIELSISALVLPLGLSTDKLDPEFSMRRLAKHFAGAASWSVIIVALYMTIEGSRRAARDLHAARLAALAAQHDLYVGELRTTQARVDPDFLFAALLDVDRDYAHGVDAGQASLDALIRFLRAALPGDGSTNSTVAREQELCEAYLAVARRRFALPLEIAFDIEPGVREAPMPAMLLLPLVRWTIADCSVRILRIRVRSVPAGVELAVESSGGGGDDGCGAQALAELHQRLAVLYPGSARLRTETHRGGRRATLAIPGA